MEPIAISREYKISNVNMKYEEFLNRVYNLQDNLRKRFDKVEVEGSVSSQPRIHARKFDNDYTLDIFPELAYREINVSLSYGKLKDPQYADADIKEIETAFDKAFAQQVAIQM